jgi:hypothetical protein
VAEIRALTIINRLELAKRRITHEHRIAAARLEAARNRLVAGAYFPSTCLAIVASCIFDVPS